MANETLTPKQVQQGIKDLAHSYRQMWMQCLKTGTLSVITTPLALQALEYLKVPYNTEEHHKPLEPHISITKENLKDLQDKVDPYEEENFGKNFSE